MSGETDIIRTKAVKTEEIIKFLKKVEADSEERPFDEAEMKLFTSLHLARMAYEDNVRLGHPALERHCMICERPLSICFC